MKKLLLAAILLSGLHVQAQVTSGVIIYESKTNIHRRLTGEREAMKAMIPEFRSTNFELVFDGNATLYKPVIEDEESFNSGGMAIRMKQPMNEIYLDVTGRAVTKQQEFMGTNYLMEDPLVIQPWKMGTETREIMGYNCRMAYYSDTTNNSEITAWFTADLPAFIGPESYNTLPGAVLAVDVNNGERVMVARSFDFRELKKNELKKPSKGEKTTSEDYKAMVEEQIERMSKNSGGVIIRN